MSTTHILLALAAAVAHGLVTPARPSRLAPLAAYNKWTDSYDTNKLKGAASKFVNKDGRLNTNERAAVSKDVEAGKFKTMDWLMKYVTRPPSRSSSRYRDMREEPREKARLDLYRKHDVNKDGRLDDAERANVRAALQKYYAEREAKRKSAAEEK